MNESEFEALTNLYFDREISAIELKYLKKELAANAERRREFQFRYRLHQATCSVLSAESVSFSEQVASKAPTNNHLKYRPSIRFGLGMAACFLVLLATSTLITREPVDNVDTFVAETSNLPDEVNDAGSQKPELQFQENLSSQLRLAGLTSETTPINQQPSRVDTEALLQRDAPFESVIEQIDPYKKYSAIPEQNLFESAGRAYELPSNNQWSTGFKSSLASFK